MLFAKLSNLSTLLHYYHRLSMSSSCCFMATLSVIKRIQLSGFWLNSSPRVKKASTRTKKQTSILANCGTAYWYSRWCRSVPWNETSTLQSREISRYAAGLTYQVEPGASDKIAFPSYGPFDQRLGYVALPNIQDRLLQRGFTIRQQVRFSDELQRYAQYGLYVPYTEKCKLDLPYLIAVLNPFINSVIPATTMQTLTRSLIWLCSHYCSSKTAICWAIKIRWWTLL